MRKNLLLLIVFISINNLFAQGDYDFLCKKLNLKDYKKSELLSDNEIANRVQNVDIDNSLTISEDYGPAPDWKWESQFGGSDKDYGRDIVTDSEGNVYVVGSFSGEINIESTKLTSIGDREAIIVKFDNAGNLIWLRNIAAEIDEQTDAFGICIDSEDNIYVTGFYTGNVSLGEFDLSDIGNYNLFLAKLDASGEFLMAVENGAVNEFKIGLKLDLDINGNIYIVGSSQTKTSWRHESIILKYDNLGNLIWEQEHDESINDLKVGEKHIYFVGVLEDNMQDGIFDDDVSLTFTGKYANAFILKSDLNGDFLWGVVGTHTADSGEDSFGEDIDIDDEENIYMSGSFREQVVFGEDTLTGTYFGYVTKCDSLGTFLWAETVDGGVQDIMVGNNNVYVLSSQYITEISKTGITNWSKLDENGSKCLGISNSNDIVISGTNSDYIFVSQLSNTAVEQWIKQSDGNSGYADVLGMVADSLGNVYTYGYVANATDYFGTIIEKGLFVSKQNYLGDIIWVNELHGVELSASYGSYMTIDPSKENIFIAGEFTEPLEIKGETTLTPDEGGSVFIIKYGVDGSYKWSLQEDFAGSELCLTADYSGNILCSGVFHGSINISGTDLLNEGSGDVFIAKYNSEGNFVWAKRAGGEWVEYSGLISVDGNDNVYLTGEFISENITVDHTEITLLEGDGNILFSKLNSAGTVQWITSFAGGPIDYYDLSFPTGIITDKQGYSYIKGWHGDSASFDDITLYSPYGDGFSYFIAKVDPNGTVVWANSITEHKYGFDYNQMDIDENGSVYLGAQALDTLSFGDDFEYINVDYKDLFLAKYTTNGNLDWVKTMGSRDAKLNSVAVWDTNFVFIGGQFEYDISFGDNELKSTEKNGFIALVGTDNIKPAITVCAEDRNVDLNDNSELLVPNLIPEVEAFDNFTADNNLIITQNPETGTYLDSDNGTTHNVIITVEDEDGNKQTCTAVLTGVKTTGIVEFSEKERLLIYPNPAESLVHIKLINTDCVEFEIKVYDLYGTIVTTKTGIGEDEVTISKAEVKNPGIYLIKIYSDQTYSGKIIFK